MYFIGVDVGQVHDYSAIATINPEITPTQRIYNCDWIERLPLETAYIDVIKRVAYIVNEIGRHQGASCVVAIDETGCGRPVVEFARKLLTGCAIIGVTITGGKSINGWNVPKRDLISSLQIGLQSGTLRIAEGLSMGDALVRELLDYKVKITENANEIYGNGRESPNDDLVLALAIAQYTASIYQPQVIGGYRES